MHTSNLLEAAQRVSDSFWLGSDKTKINMREAMIDLRVCLDAEKKKRVVKEIARPSREHA